MNFFDMTDFVGFGRGFIPMIKQDMDILDQLIQKEKEDKQDE